MAEVVYPDKRTFWKVTSSGVEHCGFTEIDQVTTAPNSYTLTSNVSADTLFLKKILSASSLSYGCFILELILIMDT